MKESKINILAGICFLALFVVLTVLLRTVDYRAVGPMGSSVGFATLNSGAAALLPYNGFWYVLSKIAGFFNILIALVFAVVGLKQLISRRNILMVNRKIVYLGIMYIVVLVLYFVFDHIIVINYRPVLDNGALAASYPSSHTLLAVTILSSAAFLLSKALPFFLPKTKRLILNIFYGMMLFSIATRLFSGVHWITDILGGVLLGFACTFLFAGFVLKLEDE